MPLKIILILTFISVIQSANILWVGPSPSLSHHIFFEPLLRALSRSNKVVSITADPINDPTLTNLTEINIHEPSYSVWDTGDLFLAYTVNKMSQAEFIRGITPSSAELMDGIFRDANVQKLINSDAQFDIIIFEYLLYTSVFGFRHRFKCPIVGLYSMEVMHTIHNNIGNPTYPSFFVDIFAPGRPDLSFWERLNNLIFVIEFKWNYFFNHLPAHEKVARKYFGQDLNLGEIEKTVDLVLVNSNPIFHDPKPIVPAMIQIGGMHFRNPGELPKELKKYLDESKEGVVYFSLGSNVKSKSLPKETFNEILTAFAELPYTILWKWEATDIPNKPKNVLLQQWLPQQDVLDHPNVKVFVTQGGIQSIEESIRSKTPMLCIPLGGDQEYNAGRIDTLKIGKRLNYGDLNKDALVTRIKEIIQNPMYQERITKVSDLLYDQPMKPLDSAVWWIEYVIRHGGAEHLRSPAAKMSWIKLLCVDVIVFLLVCTILVLTTLIFAIKYVIHLVLQSKSPSMNIRKKLK